MPEILFKQAETPEEIEQIHRLNHRVFAEEIGQHPASPDGRLIDRFHHRNRYFIAVDQGLLTGMVSVHDGPEFSIAKRLQDPAALNTLRAPLEVRLLAILPEFRKRAMLAGLFWQVFDYARRHHYSDLLISGIVERLPMYAKMGFSPMGPAVPDGAAAFVPMRACLDSTSTPLHKRSGLYARRWQRSHAISLLPGPVAISEAVREAFHLPPVSHRSKSFLAIYEEARFRLSGLMPGMATVILSGAGTLANDAVAANLRAAFGGSKGLVLSNGEFGERLLRQASRAGLEFRQLASPWGSAWDFAAIERALDEMPAKTPGETPAENPAWIWCVHLETSTGVLNPLPRLLEMAQARRVRVAADCVSSLGAVDMSTLTPEQRGALFLATGVSGKALGSFAGLSFVFLSTAAIHQLADKPLCPSFDVVAAAQTEGPLFTISSHLLIALVEALRENYSGEANRLARYAHYRSLGSWTRRQLLEADLDPLAPEEIAAPTITSFALPSPAFPRKCLQAGYKISHESEYLAGRNLGQIATMGNLDQATIEPLFEYLRSRARRERSAYSPALVSAAM